MSLTFTTAAPADVDSLIELMREFYDVEHIAFDERRARNAAQQLLSNRELGLVVLIAEAAAKIGYAVLTFGFSLEFGGRFALLDELYLRQEFRGRGLGQASLQWVEAFCRREQIAAVRLEVDQRNTAAQRLYRKNGYHDHNRDFLTKILSASETEC